MYSLIIGLSGKFQLTSDATYLKYSLTNLFGSLKNAIFIFKFWAIKEALNPVECP